MTTNHPIDPSTPRAGWLATVEDNKGAKKTRYFADVDEAYKWAEKNCDTWARGYAVIGVAK